MGLVSTLFNMIWVFKMRISPISDTSRMWVFEEIIVFDTLQVYISF
jgi:hypothetical protein